MKRARLIAFITSEILIHHSTKLTLLVLMPKKMDDLPVPMVDCHKDTYILLRQILKALAYVPLGNKYMHYTLACIVYAHV